MSATYALAPATLSPIGSTDVLVQIPTTDSTSSTNKTSGPLNSVVYATESSVADLERRVGLNDGLKARIEGLVFKLSCSYL